MRLPPYYSLFIVIICHCVLAKQKAFPEAEGFGQFSRGGRGPEGNKSGTVYIVNTVEDVPNAHLDSSITTFREALEAKGPRFVVFEVGGYFEIDKRPIDIRHPYITIAGQTAPYPGVTLRLGNEPSDTFPPVRIWTNDVVVRYIKSRPGQGPYHVKSTREHPNGFLLDHANEMDAFSIMSISKKENNGKFVQSIIIDHCSFSWASDELLGIGSPSPGGYREWNSHAKNITIQWCMLYEGISLRESRESNALGLFSNPFNNSNISIHHNLFAHLDDRAPRIQSRGGVGDRINSWYPEYVRDKKLIPKDFPRGMGEVINNTIFNYSSGIRIGFFNWCYAEKQILDIIGNKFIGNVDAVEIHPYQGFQKVMNKRHAKECHCSNDTVELDEPYRLFVDGNWGPNCNGKRYKRNQRDLIGEFGSEITVVRERNNIAWPRIEPEEYDIASQNVLEFSGASYPQRDSLDKRVVLEVQNKDFKSLVHISDTANYTEPYLKYPEFPAVKRTWVSDSDSDGIPDTWEVKNGLNVKVNDAYSDVDGNGYLNIEEYINRLGAKMYP